MADSFAKFRKYERSGLPIRTLNFEFKTLPLLELTHIANSHVMAQVESVSLYGVGLGDEGVAVLSSGCRFLRLRFLNLGSNNISDVGIEDLVTSPNFPILQELNLRRNDLRFRAAQALSNPSAMQTLKCLNVDYNENLGDGRELLSHRFDI